MNTGTLKTVFFSPTGTTREIAIKIAHGINHSDNEVIDITTPENRKSGLVLLPDDLLIMAVPVYMGRVPDLLAGWLNSVKASETPAIAVVVYGNRTYGDALLELKDVLTSRGCKVIAGAAFVGEHSFSIAEYPCSAGRPDANDLNTAESFGKRIGIHIRSAENIPPSVNLPLPGSFPYGGVTRLWDVDFISVGETCDQCGKCAEICPVAAIDKNKPSIIDIVQCITCCACIKKCPHKARSIKPGLVKDAVVRINSLYNIPKEPEMYSTFNG
jgi:ferredoxin